MPVCGIHPQEPRDASLRAAAIRQDNNVAMLRVTSRCPAPSQWPQKGQPHACCHGVGFIRDNVSINPRQRRQGSSIEMINTDLKIMSKSQVTEMIRACSLLRVDSSQLSQLNQLDNLSFFGQIPTESRATTFTDSRREVFSSLWVLRAQCLHSAPSSSLFLRTNSRPAEQPDRRWEFPASGLCGREPGGGFRWNPPALLLAGKSPLCGFPGRPSAPSLGGSLP